MKPIRFGIVGGFQAGKSTLINCLLGKTVATIGDGRATTHTIVNYIFSEKEYIEVEYIWGDNEAYEFKDIETSPDSTLSILDKAIRCTPEVQFGIVSTQNDWGTSEDANFETYIGDWVVLRNYEFAVGDEFKIRVNNEWGINYGMPYAKEQGVIREGIKYTLGQNGGNITVPVGDSYNVYFNIVTKEFCLKRKGTIPIVKAINVYLDNQFLKHSSLVDMPGYGFNEEDNKLAEHAISSVDYAIVVMTNYKAIGGEDSKLYSAIQLLQRKGVPYYLCVNCTDENKYKWSPNNRLNVDIYSESVFHLSSYMPLVYTCDDVIPIVNFMWYWYSLYPEDPIFKNYKNLLFAYGLLDNNKSLQEIRRFSNFHLIEKIFSMENRMYLELKKEIKEEIQKLKDEVCPVGTIQAFAFNRIPDGWMICDGQWLHVLDYPELFGAIGHTFGKVGENSFKIPDLRGQFVRGWSKDGEIDKGRGFGTPQDHSFQEHSHRVSDCSSSGKHSHRAGYWESHVQEANTFYTTQKHKHLYDYDNKLKDGYKTTDSVGEHKHEITIGGPKGMNNYVLYSSETRPTNVALLYCIKVGLHSEVTSFCAPDGDIVENVYGEIDDSIQDRDYEVNDSVSPISDDLNYKDIINKL